MDFFRSFFLNILPHFAYCLKKIDSISVQQIPSFSNVDLCIWAWYRKGSSVVSPQNTQISRFPIQGQFLMVSAPCKVSQRERAVKPGSCHHTQHLKVL